MAIKQQLLYFLITTFSLSIAISVVPQFIETDVQRIQLIRISAMFIPFVGVLTMKIVFRSPVKSMRWNRLPYKWILPALLIIPISIHIINLPLVALLNDFAIPWQDWLYADSSGIYHSPDSRGWGNLDTHGLTKRIAINALVGLAIVSILTFFEEIGWRAWMLPRLTSQFGIKRGILFSSIIWAAWHLPFVFGGINIIPGISLIAMTILYPIGLIGAGIVIGWFWHKTQSIWIVCLAHGALNNWGQYAFKYMKDGPLEPTNWPWLYTGINGALILTGFVILLSIKPKEEHI